MTHLEELLRNALAEFAATVDARPDLDLIRKRTAAPVTPGTAADTPASHPHEGNVRS